MKKICILFLISTMILQKIGADFFISQKELEQKGLPYSISYPITLSKAGDYITFHHRIHDLPLVGKGFSHRVCLVELDIKNQKSGKIEGHDLPIFHFFNSFGNDTKREVMVLGNNGTKIIRVDFDTNKVETLFAHEPKKPGFKSGPSIFCDQGKWYTTGWFYDKNQIWKGDYLVQIAFNSAQKASFRKKLCLENMFTRKDSYSSMYIHRYADKTFFSLVKPSEKLTYLMLHFDDKENIIDKGYKLGLFDAGRTRIYYAIQYKADGPRQHFIKDFSTNEKWKIGEDNKNYAYPFFSDNCETIVVADVDLKNTKFDILYAKAKDGYKLKTLWANEFIGPIKISNDGNILALMLKEGIKIGFLK